MVVLMDRKRTVFISYRRDDSGYAAGRLFDRLSQHFGPDRIFMDIDTIELGDDFVNVIENAVSSCDVVVSIIGSQWLAATNAEGRRRLDDPNDFVRLEIASALDKGVDIIPILLEGVEMPLAEQLPDTLRPLTRRNGLSVSNIRFNADVDRLIRGIEAIFDARAAREAAEAALVEAEPLENTHAAEKVVSTESQYRAVVRDDRVKTGAYSEISTATRQLIIMVIALGWLLSGVVFGVVHMYDLVPSMDPPLLSAAIAGVIGAAVIVIGIKKLVPQVLLDTLIFLGIGWAIGVFIGWSFSFPYGDIQIENNFPLAGAIGGVIVGLSTSYLISKLFPGVRWFNYVIIALGWSIAWSVGLLINYQLYDDYGTSFSIFIFPFLITTGLVTGLLFWQVSSLAQD
jgi:hypothetical protein